MEIQNKGMVIFVFIIISTVIISFTFSFGYILGARWTIHNPEHFCVEQICPHDYSDFSKHCMDQRCTISDDAVIDNRVISISNRSFDLVKDDAYTRGMIDGRASILEEQSTTGYHHSDLGVQESNEPSPYPQWREYANCIARKECHHTSWDWDFTTELPNITFSQLREAAGAVPAECYENETGQDPNDLVMHLTCPGNRS